MELTDLLSRLSSGGTDVSWDAWWAFATTVANNPDALARSWQAMPDPAQTELLNRLAADARPVADYLVRTLARSLPPGSASGTRRVVVEDAADAGDRQVERLRSLRNDLVLELGQSTEGMDLAVEIEELTVRRERLRAAIEADPNHSAREELEREIARLEAFRKSLRAYNRAERDALLHSLDKETAELAAERRGLEEQIRSAMDSKAQAQQDIQLRSAELAQLAEANSDIEAALARWTEAAESARALSHRATSTAAAAHDAMRDAVAQFQQMSQQCEQVRVHLADAMADVESQGGGSPATPTTDRTPQPHPIQEPPDRIVVAAAEDDVRQLAETDTAPLPPEPQVQKRRFMARLLGGQV